MKTFILGAGASRHAGYPLASELWQDIASWMERSEHEHYRNLKRKIEENHSPHLQDVEQWSTELPEDIQRDFRHAIAGFFDELRLRPATTYCCFADKCIQPGDTIISFNYDVSLERELKRAGKWGVENGYGFNISLSSASDSPVKLLKLHGSTNWCADPQFNRTVYSSAILGARYVIKQSDLEFLGCQNLVDLQSSDEGSTFDRGLVLLTPNKQFYAQLGNEKLLKDFWDNLWKQAKDCLQGCNELIVIGYSFPEADNRAQTLILQQTKRNTKISIYSLKQSEDIAGTFRKHGFKNLHPFNSMRLEDWAQQP